jgi:hypothetical protein
MFEERIDDPEELDEVPASDPPNNTEEVASMRAQESDLMPSDPPNNT